MVGARNRDPRDGMYFRGTFTDEAKAKAKAAACSGGVIVRWRKRGSGKQMFTVKSKDLD